MSDAPKPPGATNPPPRRDPVLRALAATTARVRAADRALAHLLHPSNAGNLTDEQIDTLREARTLVRAVPGDLRRCAVDHTAARRTPDALPDNVVRLFQDGPR